MASDISDKKKVEVDRPTVEIDSIWNEVYQKINLAALDHDLIIDIKSSKYIFEYSLRIINANLFSCSQQNRYSKLIRKI